MNDSLQIALRFLKFRPRTVFEIRQKLRTKKISDKEIDKTIQVLKQNKLLDDLEFAKMWVRDRNLLRPTGAYLLKLELKKLGVADAEIAKALEGQDELALAKEALVSKRQYQKAEPQKQAAFLARRGFASSVIYKAVHS